MAWSATERYGLDVAPGEFALVQDFLNTIAEGSTPPPDLLATLDSARSWAMSALEAWGVSGGWPHGLPELDEASRKHLVKFRTALFISLFGADAGDVEELRTGELDRVLGRARWTARAACWSRGARAGRRRLAALCLQLAADLLPRAHRRRTQAAKDMPQQTVQCRFLRPVPEQQRHLARCPRLRQPRERARLPPAREGGELSATAGLR